MAPDGAARTAAPTASAEAAAADPAAIEPASPAPAAARTEPPPPVDRPAQPELPLRSLQRYRQDPGFKNFMAKAQKRPGAARRPGIPGDYLDGEQRPR